MKKLSKNALIGLRLIEKERSCIFTIYANGLTINKLLILSRNTIGY